MIFYILQRRVRKALESKEQPLLIPGKVETFKPTGKKILESIEVILKKTTDNPKRWAFSANYKVPRVIGLAGCDGDILMSTSVGDISHKLTAGKVEIRLLNVR